LNRLFKNATWIVHREELKQALVPEVFEITYFRPCFDVGLATKLIGRDYEVAKGVNILETIGHTAGHISISVETDKSGVFLFTGDAAMSRENFWGSERTSPVGWPCAPSIDQRASMRSLERMRDYVDSTKAKMMKTCFPIYSHDAEEFGKWKHTPHAYE
jgi:glyoxylase-like metal-dependent hydrolase (beta-lactamase superfamily II)